MNENKDNFFSTQNGGSRWYETERTETDPVSGQGHPQTPNNEIPGGLRGNSSNNGEYRYKNEFADNDKVYTDAHYVPSSESTTPPRYYCPPQKPVKERKPRKPVSPMVKLIAACLVCAILGSLGGAAIVGAVISDRLTGIESAVETLETEAAQRAEDVETVLSVDRATAGENKQERNGLHPSAIYDMACEQVVGISSEITYTNYFGMTSSSAVTGSGFVLTADGYILTNYHVIEGAYSSQSAIDVINHEGERFDATVVGFEAENDIAVLKIEAEDLTPAVLGDSDDMRVGDTLYAVGNPLGELEFTMTTGYVSALDRLINVDSNQAGINMFQLDAAINSGNSGGPIYNDQGQVVGVATAKYSSSGVEGLGFAIPINDAKAIANDLITKGYVTGKAAMGIMVNTDYNHMYSMYYGMPIGVFVDSVSEGSCAEKAGVQAGDIITQLGETTVEDFNELKAALKRFSAGDTTTLILYRAGESKELTITFDEMKPDTAE